MVDYRLGSKSDFGGMKRVLCLVVLGVVLLLFLALLAVSHRALGPSFGAVESNIIPKGR